MYWPKLNKIDLQRKFEARVWKKGETSREYAHNKIVIGNRISIYDDNILDHLIEEIFDRSLCNQARMRSVAPRKNPWLKH